MNRPSRWPVRQVKPRMFVLEDAQTGERLSWHRTKSGALRARRQIIEARDLIAERMGFIT